MEFYNKVRCRYKPMNNNDCHWDQHQQQKVSKTFKTLAVFPNLLVPFNKGNFFIIIIKLSIAFLWISWGCYVEYLSFVFSQYTQHSHVLLLGTCVDTQKHTQQSCSKGSWWSLSCKMWSSMSEADSTQEKHVCLHCWHHLINGVEDTSDRSLI